MKVKKRNDKLTVGVFSSSSPISATVPVRYNRGKEYLKSKGIDILMVSFIKNKIITVPVVLKSVLMNSINYYIVIVYKY